MNLVCGRHKIQNSIERECSLMPHPWTPPGEKWSSEVKFLGLIGASLSEPHTSMTALRMCECMSACLLACLWPYTENLN